MDDAQRQRELAIELARFFDDAGPFPTELNEQELEYVDHLVTLNEMLIAHGEEIHFSSLPQALIAVNADRLAPMVGKTFGVQTEVGAEATGHSGATDEKSRSDTETVDQETRNPDSNDTVHEAKD